MTTPIGNTGGPLPFSPGLQVGELIFVSGMTALDPDDPTDLGLVPGDLEGQIDRTVRSVQDILRQGGAELADVVSVRAYLREIERDFAEFNRHYRRWFTGPVLPTRTTVGAALAIPELIVEIDVIARRPRGDGQ